MATFEEAKKCPKCEQPGEVGRANSIARSRDQLITMTCKNEQCKWYNTGWTIQRRPDGSIPDPDRRPREKDYPERVGGLEIARSMEVLERELEASKDPGAEVRRRR